MDQDISLSLSLPATSSLVSNGGHSLFSCLSFSTVYIYIYISSSLCICFSVFLSVCLSFSLSPIVIDGWEFIMTIID